MGRYYHLSKKLTEEQAEEVEKELKVLEDVKDVKVTSDHEYLKVVTKDNEFSRVMGQAVNICSRAAAGAEISFAGFAYDKR